MRNSPNRSMRLNIQWPLPAVLVAGLVLVLSSCGTATRHTASAAKRPDAAKTAATAKRPDPAPTVPLRRMLGQMIVARFTGTMPSRSLLARVRAGQVGGVILFADNFAAGVTQVRAAIAELQRTAREGGNPGLFVMTDQEGGEVRRVPGPPTLAPSEMTSPGVALAQGKATGKLLHGIGVNVDLAPVADVERVAGSFLGSRSFGSQPAEVAAAACAFAKGIASANVAYTLKHFPGLGRAVQSTDFGPVSINAAAKALRSDYAPYDSCGGAPLALVMVSNAIYPRLTGSLPAVMAPLTYTRELPIATLRPSVVTISDDLQAGALAHQKGPARHAINAGLDLLLYASTEQASANAYAILLREARSGVVSRTRIRTAYAAVVALKRQLSLVADG